LAYLQAYALLKIMDSLKPNTGQSFSHVCAILEEPTIYLRNSEFPENDL